MAPKTVPTTSRERPGSVSGRPRCSPGASGESPWAHRAARKDARERPGARRDDQDRRKVAFGTEKIAFASRPSSAKHRRSDCSPFFVDFRFFREIQKTCFVWPWPHETGFGPSRCESSRSRDSTSKNTENRPENRPEIVENRVSGPNSDQIVSKFEQVWHQIRSKVDRNSIEFRKNLDDRSSNAFRAIRGTNFGRKKVRTV